MGPAEVAVAAQVDATLAPIPTAPAEAGAVVEVSAHRQPELAARVVEHLSASISMQLIL